MDELRLFYLNVRDHLAEIYYNNYIGTTDFLTLFDSNALLEISSFYADEFNDANAIYVLGDIAHVKTVGDMREFIESKPELGIIDIEGVIAGSIKFSSHDEYEISISMNNDYAMIRELLGKIVSSMGYNDILSAYLYEYNDKYILIDDKSTILRLYDSFDDFLADNK